MPKIRDYEYQDLRDTINLMKLLSEIIGMEFNEENWRHTAKYRAFNPEFRTLVAEEDNRIVGMCFADIQRDDTGRFHGLIRNVIVDPAYRGKNIASELIKEAINLFLDLKVNTVRVQVSDKIKDVTQVFEKLNFRCTINVLEIDVFKIREYRESDYEMTKQLMEMYSKLINVPFKDEEWKKTIKIRMKNPQYRILISEKDDIITGMALITITSDEIGLTIGNIENVVVHPKYRRLGFGKALLGRAIETFNVLNVDKIRIMTHLEVSKWSNYFEDVGFHKTANIMQLKLLDSK